MTMQQENVKADLVQLGNRRNKTMVIEWLAFTIIFLGILIYKITDRYFEYKEHISKIEKSKE